MPRVHSAVIKTENESTTEVLQILLLLYNVPLLCLISPWPQFVCLQGNERDGSTKML